MKCPKCGFENNDSAKFCINCGSTLTQVTNAVTQQPITPNAEQEEKNSNVELLEEKNNVEVPLTPQNPIMEEVHNPANQPGLNSYPKNNNKSKLTVFLVVGIIIIICIVLICFMALSGGNEEKKLLNDKYDSEKYIPVEINNRYGYINNKGKVVLEAKYNSASQFYDGYAIVRTEAKVNNINRSVSQIINKKGKVIKQANNIIDYIDDANMWLVDNEIYNSSMKKISPKNAKADYAGGNYFVWLNSKNSTGGIMNKKGKITYKYKLQNTDNFFDVKPSKINDSLKTSYCIINVNNDKYGIVNCETGKVIYDFTNNYISTKDNNIFEVKESIENSSYLKRTKETLYINDDKIIYKSPAPRINISYYPNYLYIIDYDKSYYNGRYAYFDLKTMEITSELPEINDSDELYKEPWEKETKINTITQSNKYGLEQNKKIILEPTWDRIAFLDVDLYNYLKQHNKNYILGKKNDSWYLIDLKTKKPVYEFNTTYVYLQNDTTFLYYIDNVSHKKKIFNLLSGNSMEIDKNNYPHYGSNYVKIEENGKTSYYNTDLKLIFPLNN